MKNILGLALIAGMFAFTSCGPSAEEKAQAEKFIQDSTAAAEAQMKAVEDAARAQAEQDSLAAVAAMSDSTAAPVAQ